MRPCFKFTARAADKPAILALDDEIGFWGTQAKDFRASLDAVEGNELRVEINSPGGDVFAGLSMYNMLRSWASAEGHTLVTRVTGIAASMGSVIALAGDKREMPNNTMAMIHGPSGIAFGTSAEMREQADVLDKIGDNLRNIYVDRMGVEPAEVEALMAKDSWLTADEAKDMGFATDLIDGVVATAKFDMARADLPSHVKAIFVQAKEEPETTPEPEVVPEPVVPDTPVAQQIAALAKADGWDGLSSFFALTYTDVTVAKSRLSEAREIKALAEIAGHQDFAAKAIKDGLSVAQAREQLVAKLADEDEKTDIDTSQLQKRDEGAVSANFNPSAIWDSHNAQAKGNAK